MFAASQTNYGFTHIDTMPLHGIGDHHHIIESQLGAKNIQFAVDRQVSEIYWSDSNMKQISWTDYSGMLSILEVFQKF